MGPLIASIVVMLCAIAPWLFVYLAWKKMQRQRREIEALPDDNTVIGDPDGARKTHEYLTAITSTEARIGLLQRSDPWPGDQPPADDKA